MRSQGSTEPAERGGEHVPRVVARRLRPRRRRRCGSARRTPPGPSTSRISREPASSVRCSRPNTDAAARPSASAAERVSSQCARNSAAIASPAPFTETPSRGVRTRKCRPPSEAMQVDGVVRGVVGDQRRRQHHPGAEVVDRGHGVLHRGQGVGRRPRQQVELEVVRRDDVGGRDGDLAQELLDARPHEDPAADVADDRVAAVDGVGVRLAHLSHGGTTACPMSAEPR